MQERERTKNSSTHQWKEIVAGNADTATDHRLEIEIVLEQSRQEWIEEPPIRVHQCMPVI